METPDPKYKHKPSEKHTLEEVLKSLQDLIRNDLSESTAGANRLETSAAGTRQPDTAPKTPESKQRRENKPVAREDFAPVSPGSGPVNLDAVMRSLKDLIGNELNVGDEPKPASGKSASAHDEYLSTEEKIEEYIPDELAGLDEELNNLDKHIANETEPAPSRNEFPAPEEITAASLPEELTPFDEDLTIEAPPAPESPPATPLEPAEASGEIAAEPIPGMVEPAPEEFAPLDEELTFDEPLPPTPPPAMPTETAELPGEISLELLEEPVAEPPATLAPSPAPETDLAPGTQQDMFLEPAPPRAPEPEAVATDSIPVIAAEAKPAPEPRIPVGQREQPVEAKQESAAEALPTIDVEESFDDNDYFAAPPPSDENQLPATESEETIALDAEIVSEPEIVAPPIAETAAPDAPATPAGPAGKKPRDEYSVDFDSSDLSPPLPEESELGSLETGAAVAGQTPAETASVPAPESKAAAPSPEPPAVETKVETPAETEPTLQAAKTPASETSASRSLDDIPVLNEVVAPPAGGVPKAKPTAPRPKSPLPAPDRARDIVVRAVAKLNVEMRKTGGTGLDTKTILRLQQLIRQELEKGGEK